MGVGAIRVGAWERAEVEFSLPVEAPAKWDAEHPNLEKVPSDDDVRLTRRLVEAGKVLGILVLDHVIVGDGAYLSLKGSKDIRFG